jgi:hypothetical protein
MDSNKIDFKELFDMGQWRLSEDVEFVTKFALEQQALGKLSDTEILSQCVQHLARESCSARGVRVMAANRQISQSIVELTKLGAWSNLRAAACDAMQSADNVLQAECAADPSVSLHNIRLGTKVMVAMFDVGTSKYEEVFYPEFLIKHGYPTDGVAK